MQSFEIVCLYSAEVPSKLFCGQIEFTVVWTEFCPPTKFHMLKF